MKEEIVRRHFLVALLETGMLISPKRDNSSSAILQPETRRCI
jgi:hypothetical protein